MNNKWSHEVLKVDDEDWPEDIPDTKITYIDKLNNGLIPYDAKFITEVSLTLCLVFPKDLTSIFMAYIGSCPLTEDELYTLLLQCHKDNVDSEYWQCDVLRQLYLGVCHRVTTSEYFSCEHKLLEAKVAVIANNLDTFTDINHGTSSDVLCYGDRIINTYASLIDVNCVAPTGIEKILEWTIATPASTLFNRILNCIKFRRSTLSENCDFCRHTIEIRVYDILKRRSLSIKNTIKAIMERNSCYYSMRKWNADNIFAVLNRMHENNEIVINLGNGTVTLHG